MTTRKPKARYQFTASGKLKALMLIAALLFFGWMFSDTQCDTDTSCGCTIDCLS